MSVIEAVVVADSVCPYGNRITTFEATVPKFILAEINKHRVISNNAQSTRAVPLRKQIEQVQNDPFIPVFWGLNAPGMASIEEATNINHLVNLWLTARDNAVSTAEEFMALNIHKQTVGRLLEPFAWCKVVLTATSWSNFIALRTDSGAQPEIQRLACSIRDGLASSVPVLMGPGDWHMPYAAGQPEERALYIGATGPVLAVGDPRVASVTRCARVSYGRQGTTRPDLDEYERYKSLVDNRHWSAFEHTAQCMPADYVDDFSSYKHFYGWVPLRSMFPGEHDASLQVL